MRCDRAFSRISASQGQQGSPEPLRGWKVSLRRGDRSLLASSQKAQQRLRTTWPREGRRRGSRGEMHSRVQAGWVTSVNHFCLFQRAKERKRERREGKEESGSWRRDASAMKDDEKCSSVANKRERLVNSNKEKKFNEDNSVKPQFSINYSRLTRTPHFHFLVLVIVTN